jgi:hypothetical protein
MTERPPTVRERLSAVTAVLNRCTAAIGHHLTVGERDKLREIQKRAIAYEILSGELHIPRERWNLASFLSTVTESAVRPS